jgi:acyl-CoA thioesterase FadM
MYPNDLAAMCGKMHMLHPVSLFIERWSFSMNLIFRMFLTIFLANRKPKMRALDMSRMFMRVLPTDLDIQMHMNNGRYLSIMDLGRIDMMVRVGFWSIARSKGWFPVVGAARMEYRRSLTVFQRYEMTSQIVAWDDRWIFVEQQFLYRDKLCTRAVFKTMIRSKDGLVTPKEVMAATGLKLTSPELTDEMKGMG